MLFISSFHTIWKTKIFIRILTRRSIFPLFALFWRFYCLFDCGYWDSLIFLLRAQIAFILVIWLFQFHLAVELVRIELGVSRSKTILSIQVFLFFVCFAWRRRHIGYTRFWCFCLTHSDEVWSLGCWSILHTLYVVLLCFGCWLWYFLRHLWHLPALLPECMRL